MAAVHPGAVPGNGHAVAAVGRSDNARAAASFSGSRVARGGGSADYFEPAHLFGGLAGADQSRVLVGRPHRSIALPGAVRFAAPARGARRRGTVRSGTAPALRGKLGAGVLRRRSKSCACRPGTVADLDTRAWEAPRRSLGIDSFSHSF